VRDRQATTPADLGERERTVRAFDLALPGIEGQERVVVIATSLLVVGFIPERVDDIQAGGARPKRALDDQARASQGRQVRT
jgi:hypothetical protein